MNLIEMNDRLLVNKDRRQVTVPEATQEKCDLFRRLVESSKTATNMFNSLEDANAFFAIFPDLRKILGTGVCVEVFYACKLKYAYDGVPARLVYILNKAFTHGSQVHVNATLNTVTALLKPYVNDVYTVNGETATVKDIIENVLGRSVKLLTSSVRKVKATDCFEVYVPNVERVALLPPDIANMLPVAECEKIRFDREKGLVIDNVIIRTLNNRLGITRDDFDLIKCI